MTPPIRRDPDRALEAFFEPGPRHLSDALAAAIRDDVHHTRQRRGLPRWEGNMSRFAIPVAALGAVAVVVVAVVLLTSNPTDVVAPGVSGTPNPSPSAASSPSSAAPNSPAPSAELLAPLGYQGAGTIAFTRSDSSADGDTTWLISPDGSGATQVSVLDWDTRAEYTPACCALFSWDGTQIAVADLAPNSGLMETRILTVDGTQVRGLPNCGACAYVDGINYVPGAWSPDGSLVALEVWSDDDPTRNGLYLAFANTAGWAEQVAGNYDDVPLAFSPDGTRLLFLRRTAGEQGTLMELTIPDLSGVCCGPNPRRPRGETHLVGLPDMVATLDGYFGAPASWSPDGRQIAFAATDPSLTDDRMRIWVVDADGGEPVPITPDASIYTGASWSPDGQWIAFDREADIGHHDALITRPDGSDVRNLTNSFAPGVCCARWSPDSSALLVAGTTGDNERSYLFIVPLDGSPVAQVTTAPGFYKDFSWGGTSR